MLKLLIISLAIGYSIPAPAQDMMPLVMRLKAKLDQVQDYEAVGRVKTNVVFIKAPVGRMKIYFKRPNRFRLKKEKGISLLPKGGVSININSLITTDHFMAIDAGDALVNKVRTKMVKLLPTTENSDVVLTTLYIDEANLLVKKAVATTRENGTYEMEMEYGRFAQYGLPDKLVFSFNTKDYKLPQGLALEFDENDHQRAEPGQQKTIKGKVEIVYTEYIINKGIPDSVFH